LLWPAVAALFGASFPSVCWVFLAVVAGLALVAYFRLSTGRYHFLGRGALRSKKKFYQAMAVLVALAMGSWRGLGWEKWINYAQLLAESGKDFTVTLSVLDDPELRKGRIVFRGRIYRIEDPVLTKNSCTTSQMDAGILALVTLYNPEKSIRINDFIVARGKFELPLRAQNPGEFDYRRYLRSKKIFVELKGTVKNVSSGGLLKDTSTRQWFLSYGLGTRIFLRELISQAVGEIKHFIEYSIDENFPESERAILKGIFLAEKREISRHDEEALKRAGFYRFVTIAGFHVDFVSRISGRLFRKRTKNTVLSRIISCAIAFFYASVSSWNAGAMRACTCSFMRMFAPYLRRKYDTISGLALSGLILAWTIPYPLFDVGFQLSFVGSFAVWFALNRPLCKIYRGSIALWLFVFLFPLLALYFQDVSFWGFMLGGVWSTVTGALIVLGFAIFFIPGTGHFLGWLPFLILRGIRLLSHLLAKIPLGFLSVPIPNRAELIAYYVFVLVLFVPSRYWCVLQKGSSLEGKRWCRHVLLLAAALIFFVSAFLRNCVLWPDITFLSVGQGDCALIRYKKVAIMVDTGTGYAFSNIVLPYLKRQGIKKIDLCILSHLHEDHAGGVSELCEKIDVGAILTASGTKNRFEKSFLVPVIEAVPKGKYRLGDVGLTILYAGEDIDAGLTENISENEMSLVFLMEFGHEPVQIEFWGDAPCSVVSKVLRDKALVRNGLESTVFQPEGSDRAKKVEKTVIVKVPHHGSAGSLVEGFYERISSGHAVISVGPNSYGHPSPSVLYAARKNGVSLWRTDLNGAITVRSFLGRLKVRPFHEAGH